MLKCSVIAPVAPLVHFCVFRFRLANQFPRRVMSSRLPIAMPKYIAAIPDDVRHDIILRLMHLSLTFNVDLRNYLGDVRLIIISIKKE